MTWLQELLDNTLFQTFLAIIAIVGFAYGFIFQRINKEKKEFSYCLKSNHLIRKKKSKFEKISISYDGKQIEDLCVSKFTIWNSGNRTLNSIDMVDSKELTISTLDSSIILDVEIIACSDETNKFSVKSIDDHTIKVNFDYVDKKEGVIVQIIHTGTDSDIQIDCKIKGGKQIKNINNNKTTKFIGRFLNSAIFESFSMFFYGVAIILFFLMFIVSFVSIFNVDLQNALFPLESSSIENSYSPQNSAIITSITFFVSLIIMGGMYFPIIKRFFNMGIPKSLKDLSGFKN
ncbi:MAG: hypothetical protein E7522_04920 [Ruminococcaceae bacterium]|nr:hypothetical protein [Oscillospiraceae bacterium]